ncbi:MAG: TlpA family protein disulfide reductase [Woeseiaceae bacterium]
MKTSPASVVATIRIAVLAAALLGIAGAGSATESEDCLEAPNFNVATIDNARVSLAELKGQKPLYLKFWLSSCPQCIAEMPHFVHSYEQYGDGIEIVAVNLAMDETMQTLEQALADHGLEMPVVFDESREMQTIFEVYGTPTHVVIDKHGRIVHVSNAADEALDAALDCVSRRTD